MLVAASSVAHAPRPRSTTDQRRSRATILVGGGAVAQCPGDGGHRRGPVEAGAALPGVFAVEVGQHRCGHRDRAVVGDHRDRTAAQPAAEPAECLVIQRGIEHGAVEQAGEVAAHQRAPHPVGGNTVQGKQFGERQTVRNLVEAGRSAGAGDGHQEACPATAACPASGTRPNRGAAGRAGWPASRHCSPGWAVRRRPPRTGRGGLSVGLTGPPLSARTAAVSSPAMYPGSTIRTATRDAAAACRHRFRRARLRRCAPTRGRTRRRRRGRQPRSPPPTAARRESGAAGCAATTGP